VSAIETPPAAVLAEMASAAPPVPGGEYLNADVLAALWEKIETACRAELADAKQTLQEFLKGRNPAWHLIGRVHFNLAENRSDEEAPFAFIATYTARLSAQSRAQHLPLAEALREYAGAHNKARLLSLLKPVQEAARECAWLKAVVESGELYHPPQMVRSRSISIADRCTQPRGRWDCGRRNYTKNPLKINHRGDRI
jgi:hypothetical protein